MYSKVATVLLLISPLVSIGIFHPTLWITNSSQLQVVLGAPGGFYDPYDVPRNAQFQPMGPPRGSRSLGGILSIPNVLFNILAQTGLGTCIGNGLLFRWLAFND